MSADLDILLCTDYLPPSDGGVEHVVDQLARRLAERGYSVGIFTLTASNDHIQLAGHPDIRVTAAHRIELTDYIGLQSAVSFSAIREFKRTIDAYHPDVVHVHNRFFFTSYLGLLYSATADYALVTSLHLGELDELEGIGGLAANAFQGTFAKQLLRQSNAVICVSEAAATVARELGAQQKNTHVVHNAVDLERFDVAPREFDKTLLYIGRLVSNNGPHDLLSAVPSILDAHPETTVHLVGSGPLKEPLAKQVRELGIEDAVTLHGFVDDITEMYAGADVFCRPSYSEGLPLTLLESMATYTVPVVTPVAGAGEVVEDGSTGCFVDVGEPETIAQAINALFNDSDKIADMAHAGRSYVESVHSWSQRTEKISRIYEQARSD